MKTTKTYLIASLLMLAFLNPALSQSTAPSNDTAELIRSLKTEKCSFLEVSKEMFELLASDERAEGKVKEYFTQLNHLIYLHCPNSKNENEGQDLSRSFESVAEKNHFKLLMRSESAGNKNLFFKRTEGEVNEYLLATTTRIQYVATTLDITSIREMTQIMEVTGEAGGL